MPTDIGQRGREATRLKFLRKVVYSRTSVREVVSRGLDAEMEVYRQRRFWVFGFVANGRMIRSTGASLHTESASGVNPPLFDPLSSR